MHACMHPPSQIEMHMLIALEMQIIIKMVALCSIVPNFPATLRWSGGRLNLLAAEDEVAAPLGSSRSNRPREGMDGFKEFI